MTFPPAGGILEHKGGFLMREFFHNMKLSFLLAAVLYIILGLILMIWPGVSATVFCYAFGGILLIYGVVTIVSFFLRDSRQGSFVFELFLGIVAAALGLLFLLRPVIVASYSRLKIADNSAMRFSAASSSFFLAAFLRLPPSSFCSYTRRCFSPHFPFCSMGRMGQST